MDDVDEMDVDNDEASDGGSNEGDNECEDGDDNVVDNNEDGLLDEDEMSMEEKTSLKESVKPIQLILTKVSQQTSTTLYQLRGLSLAIKNSSTIILPKWYNVLDNLTLKQCMMPRDVATRWNSMYNMLEFTINY